MDFFIQQDKARRQTGWLVFLFILAVVSLIGLTNLLIGLVVWSVTQEETMQRGLSVVSQTDTQTIAALFSWHTFGLVSLAVAGAVGCAILYKWFQLSSGGKAVAESLGGIRIYPNSEDPDHLQVLNVVEEVALASGMPVPAVYLLEHEIGINAFAAGNGPADAVIGVTKGCIQQFKRDELQGVIAHEFSHILNGDMRLNLRLIALLHGIVFIGLVGELLLRGSRSRRSDSRVAILGVALLAIGWLGTFFGNLIRAAVSRQREFLADASAVQFTRNPDGIASALKLIGGYSSGTEIHDSHRSEVSHLFFGQAISKLSNMMATHPPLVDRILKVDPDWDGNYLYRSTATRERKQEEEKVTQAGKREAFSQAVITGAAVASGIEPDTLFSGSADLDQIRREIDGIPALLHEQAHDPFGAIAVCYLLITHIEPSVQEKQWQVIAQSGIKGIEPLMRQLYPAVEHLDISARLPLIELLLPALKCMSPEQYKRFKQTLLLLIRADAKTDLFEWCLYQLVRHYLAGEFEPVKASKPRYKEAKALSDEYQLVLSVLAHKGHEQEADAQRAFNRGAGSAGLYNISLLSEDACELECFIRAVNVLSCAYPALKPRLITGIKKCIHQDGEVTALEKEIVSSIAVVMDAPIPLFIEPH
ncbi:M48 family metallopeptidase [Neptuniibacter marinus]|uniref:M48 family metallopeptidase n=1 Tax=Neptuniibacter marinus TaxID=1806670 RepID=UPI003B5CC329